MGSPSYRSGLVELRNPHLLLDELPHASAKRHTHECRRQVDPHSIERRCGSFIYTSAAKKGLRTALFLTLVLVWFVVGLTLLATTPVHQTYWKQVLWAVNIAPQGIDMSFPATTLMNSNFVTKEHQRVAASLVATVVCYSQPIGLGIAGTVEIYVRDGDIFKGLRAAMYSAVALSGVGLLAAFGYVAYGSAYLHHFSQTVKRK